MRVLEKAIAGSTLSIIAVVGYQLVGCTIVECPGNMVCTLKAAGAGGSGNSGAVAGVSDAGESGAGASDAGTEVDDGSNGAPDLPPGGWVNVTGNLAGKASGCGNLDALFLTPKTDVIVAGILGQGLWTSSAGKTWKALGTGAGSAKITNGPQTLVFDPDDPKRFWEAGIYGDTVGGYTTTDAGKTFTPLSITYSDSIAIDFSDPKRRLLLSAAHERHQQVYKSTDGGITWNNVGLTLPADRFCTVVLIVDSSNYLVGCSGANTGIFRTSDGAKHWTQVSESGGNLRPLVASDGSIYWSTPFSGQLVRSTDAGLTWQEVLPANSVPPVPIIELPDGRIAALSFDTIVVSANHGQTWDYASARLPHTNPQGLLYSPSEKAFFVWRSDCGLVVLDDAVTRFDFDYQTQ